MSFSDVVIVVIGAIVAIASAIIGGFALHIVEPSSLQKTARFVVYGVSALLFVFIVGFVLGFVSVETDQEDKVATGTALYHQVMSSVASDTALEVTKVAFEITATVGASIPSTVEALARARVEALMNPSPTPQPLQFGTGSIHGLDYRSGGTNYGYSFSRGGQLSSAETPADITLEHCGITLNSELTCYVRASQLFVMGSVPLDEVVELPESSDQCPESGCVLRNGESFIVETYNGHYAKFRIQSTEYEVENKSFSVGFEWVYQPNDSANFLE